VLPPQKISNLRFHKILEDHHGVLALNNSHLNTLQKQNYLGQVFTSVGQLLSFGPVIIDEVVKPFINNNLSVGYSFFLITGS
jgi:hypothetical protein